MQENNDIQEVEYNNSDTASSNGAMDVVSDNSNGNTDSNRMERFQPDIQYGLNDEQVRQRFEGGYVNYPVDPPSKTVKEIIFSNVFTYFNLIFCILAVLVIVVGSFKSLTFMPVIIFNTLIGIIQQIRSKNTLDKLTMLNAPKAVVVRNGRRIQIPASELVLDDIVVFQSGVQIPADGTVRSGEIQVNEALITGESDEITKKCGDQLLSGSFVVSGECYAQMDKVGAESYISKLTIEAKTLKEPRESDMMKSLNRLVKIIGFIIIPVGSILFWQSFVSQNLSLRKSVISMVAAIIGMIPEGLYLLVSVALVVSVMRLARQKVLIHEMQCIETLARVDVLCVDKTGTITENVMETNNFIALDGYDQNAMQPLDELIGMLVHNMSSDNSTMNALQKYFKKGMDKKADLVIPFSSTTKYSSIEIENQSYVLGAPEFVLREQYDQYKQQIEQYSSEGFRVLVFGKYNGQVEKGKALTENVDAYALIFLSNPIRKAAPSTFEYFREQGVAIKVISGDNPITVSKIAKKANIEFAENYIDASTLKTPGEIFDAVAKYTVFGRVTPSQKRLFVQALKAQGHTVAMTGDGVNDVLALKDADCSVAMASGSDAAAQASQIVLLESDFSKMPEVVAEGRRVVNNIERSSSLFLVKNIFSLLMALFAIFTVTHYPLTPSQISMVSMFTIGIPAAILALEPNKNRIHGRFLSNVLLRALPAGLTNFIVISALVVFGDEFNVEASDISTASALILSVVGLLILWHISKPMNKLRVITFIGMVIGLLVSIFGFNDLFSISNISVKCTMLLVLFTITTEPILRYLTILITQLKLLGIWISNQRYRFK